LALTQIHHYILYGKYNIECVGGLVDCTVTSTKILINT